jgi:hypothetical protein
VAKRDPVDQAADELYGLPPGEFTRERNARVKEVRKGGDREAADAIKGLRKPTVAAWALNQLSRRRPKDVERLVKAGEELRAAQEELLAGGERAAFQEAANRERELVADLSNDATAMASEAGERGGGLQEKIAETLHAAALDEETADELRAGRLVREREAIGGFGAPGGGPAPAAKPTRAKPKKAGGKTESKPARGKASAEARRREATTKAEARRRKATTKAEARRREAAAKTEERQRVSAAQTAERHARRALEQAERALEHAEERAAAAAAHAQEAVERARTTAERVKDARRETTAARRAHKAAERALESAERGRSHRS